MNRVLTALAVNFVATSASQAESLANLRHGVYFEKQYSCSRAPYMQAEVWTGKEFTSSRSVTEIATSKGSKASVVAYIVDDAGGRHRQGQGKLIVTGRRSYRLVNDFGKFDFRWCGSDIDAFVR